MLAVVSIRCSMSSFLSTIRSTPKCRIDCSSSPPQKKILKIVIDFGLSPWTIFPGHFVIVVDDRLCSVLSKNRSIALPYHIPYRYTLIYAYPPMYVRIIRFTYNNILACRYFARRIHTIDGGNRGAARPRSPEPVDRPLGHRDDFFFGEGGMEIASARKIDVHARGQRRENPLAKRCTRTHRIHRIGRFHRPPAAAADTV